MVDEKTMIDAYDAIAPHYEQYSLEKSNYLEAIEKIVIEKLKDKKKLLDIGSGDGRRLKKVMDGLDLEEVYSVEPSSEMAKICRANINQNVHTLLGEDLDQLEEGNFDAITALWNVFGHITTSESRIKTLTHIKNKLNKEGLFILDVNNRHNAKAYGHFKVLGRRLLDFIAFKEERGDAKYDWKIGDQSFKASGHLFIPQEVENLAKASGLKIIEQLSVNYRNGEVSSSKFKGQLLYILKKAD